MRGPRQGEPEEVGRSLTVHHGVGSRVDAVEDDQT